MSQLMCKKPAFLRESILKEIVISDLCDMERTGNFDRNVLLWIQDRYIDKAMPNFLRQTPSPCELALERRRWTASLVEHAQDSYARERETGHIFDLKAYVDAAKAFYSAEILRFGGYLHEFAEYMTNASKNGVTVDIDTYARRAFVGMAKMSLALQHLENVGGNGTARSGSRSLSVAIEQINGAAGHLGRQLLKAVETISGSPQAYIEFNDPSAIEMPGQGPWDFEPLSKSEEFGF